MKKLILLLLLLSTHSFAQTQQDMDKLWNTLLQDAGIDAGDNEAGVTALRRKFTTLSEYSQP